MGKKIGWLRLSSSRIHYHFQETLKKLGITSDPDSLLAVAVKALVNLLLDITIPGNQDKVNEQPTALGDFLVKSKIGGFINAARNENLVFVVIDNDRQKYIMGDELRPAVYARAPYGLGNGKDAAARKGMSLYE